MCPLVIDTIRVGREASAAVLAHMWLVTGVRSHVEHEAGILPECLAAYMTKETFKVRILLLFNTLVNSRVSLQLNLFLEGFVTLFTRIRFRFLLVLLLIFALVYADAHIIATRAVLFAMHACLML